MNDRSALWARGTVLVALTAPMSGCVMEAAQAVLSPMMGSAMEASLTPENMGITTSPYRGLNCAQLESSLAQTSEINSANVAKGDTTQTKLTGWKMDAINQVRGEMGCIAGGPPGTVPASGQVTAYGYCMAVSEKANYLTPMFTYGDYYSDRGSAESEAFNAMLKSTYGYLGNPGYCLMEDSPAKAAAAIDRQASVTTLVVGWDTIRVAWTPPPIEKSAKPLTKVSTLAPLPTSANSTPVDLKVLGLNLESPSPELARALGLKRGEGAWVVSVAPASPAAKAGIKPMDVILDLSGQEVKQPDDVQTISSRLRSGFRAPVAVWRDHAQRELTIYMPKRAASVATVAKVETPTTAQPVVASISSTTEDKTFCHAYIYVVKKPGGWQSEIVQTSSANITPASMMASLSSFVSTVRQQQPDAWRPFSFPASQCSTPSGYCYANGEKSLFKPDQMAGQFCFATRAEAQTHYASFNSVKPIYDTVKWTP